MSFSQKLSGILANLPADDPLFGGLIPRKQERPVERTIEYNEPTTIQQSRTLPVRKTGMERVGRDFVENSNQPRNIKFDWTEQELGLAGRKLGLERDKFGHERNKDEREFELKEREQNRKEFDDKNRLSLDRNKFEIDSRRQALDEWRTRNPEGEVKTTEDGSIVIIDKRTGKSIDTGLKADHLNETDKLRIQHQNRIKEIELRNKGGAGNRPRNINPSQQRTAERDAFIEVKNSGRYKDIDKYVEMGADGTITINRPSPEESYQWFRSQGSNDQRVRDIQNINAKIAEFEKEWKTKTDERINRTFSGEFTEDNDIVDMTAPDGRALRVPKADVESMKAAGAKLVDSGNEEDNEPIGKSLDKMIQVDDSIELMYNDKGKVVGARNRKPTSGK